MKSLVLFNNKGGVGKTTLTFNIAHMLSRRGQRVAAIDCDPQCNLSALLLGEAELVDIWSAGAAERTVAGCVDLVGRGSGDVCEPGLAEVAPDLWLLPGKLDLSRFDETLAQEWATIADPSGRGLDVTTALARLSDRVAEVARADIVLIDVAPALGGLNHAALLACDAVLIPLAPDIFSVQGLKIVGPVLRGWRQGWSRIRQTGVASSRYPRLPSHDFRAIGYIVQHYLARSDRPKTGIESWSTQIPSVFHEKVLGETGGFPHDVASDPMCIASVKHFASLVPIAQQVRKPLFDLKKADGIGGGQIQAVANCRRQFEEICDEVLKRLGGLPGGTARAEGQPA